MKAILEFNLPEENEDHYLALNGANYSTILDELDNDLRTLSKYDNQEMISIDDVREMIRNLKDTYEVL